MTTRARVPHVIRPNASGAAPSAWVTFAVNTNEEAIDERRSRHTLREVAAIYWRPSRESKLETLEYRTFRDSASFVRYCASLIRSKERLAITAHGIDFAAQALDIHCELRKAGYRPTRIIIEKGKWQQRWKEGKNGECDGSRSMLWLDLQNFFPSSLRQTAKWLGLAFPRPDGNDADWLKTSDGAKWRATVTLRGVQAWLDVRDRFDLGYFSATLAGQAFNAYRHRFMTHPIYVHVHHDVIEMEKEANFGARVECRFKGRAPKDDYCQVDVTSFYASVMRGTLYPCKQVGHVRRIGLSHVADLLKSYSIIARCTIATEVPRYPKREGSSVIYPIGRFQTTLSTPEIKDALADGSLASVEECVVYEHAPIFDEYVDFFWNLRLRAMRADDRYVVELAKRFLTAVFGKFGQRVWLSELVRTDASGEDRIWREFDWQDSVEYEYRIVAGRMERAIREMLGRDTLLAIPAHVTAYGRSKLWRLMEKAGRKHIYYVDTDSFIGRKVILQNLGDEFAAKTLGGLRLIKTSSHLFIRAPKWYIFGDKTARAGVPNSAYEIGWNTFEGDEDRSMHWALSHDSPCQAITERIRVVGPLTERQSSCELGHFIEPLRYGEPPVMLPGLAAQFPLPLSFPE